MKSCDGPDRGIRGELGTALDIPVGVWEDLIEDKYVGIYSDDISRSVLVEIASKANALHRRLYTLPIELE